MNLFFGIESDTFKSKIYIPKFQNSSHTTKNLKLFKIYPNNKNWLIEEVVNNNVNSQFFFIDNEQIKNNEAYFIAKNEDIKYSKYPKLEIFNAFTENLPTKTTFPTFRSNLEIFKTNSGFSSYQSEYPFKMLKIKSSVVSSITSVTNKNANNYIFFRNIYEYPIHEEFKGFIVNIKKKIILSEFTLITNMSNLIKIDNYLLEPENFFVTDKYVGIPIFISEKDGHLSLEHTNPPNSNILGKDRLKISKIFKQRFYDVINN